MWEQTNLGDWGEICYGPHREVIDKELAHYIERGSKRFPELYRNTPVKRTVNHLHVYHVDETSYLSLTESGYVPSRVALELGDIGECNNHWFGWDSHLSYEFYDRPERPTLKVVVTNLKYKEQWLAQEAKRAALALFGVLRRRKICTKFLPRYLIARFLLANADAWQPRWELLASPIEKHTGTKRLKTE